MHTSNIDHETIQKLQDFNATIGHINLFNSSCLK